MKLNCWDFKKCGRQPGGKSVDALGICPAAIDVRLHGVHDGVNSGRCCWIVTGTLCEGEVQGTYGTKSKNCNQCDFYQRVRIEEGMYFQLSILLLSRLKNTQGV